MSDLVNHLRPVLEVGRILHLLMLLLGSPLPSVVPYLRTSRQVLTDKQESALSKLVHNKFVFVLVVKLVHKIISISFVLLFT